MSNIQLSISGTLTLLILIFIGPVIYLCCWLYYEKGIGNCADRKNTSDEQNSSEYYRREETETGVSPALSSSSNSNGNGGITTTREEIGTTNYTFALLGYAIGIGNIWRFPYVISQNGGGAALVAYLICAVSVAVPLFLYEMILGQYTRKNAINTFRSIKPRWTSFAVAQGILLLLITSYFGMVIAYTFPYIVGSCLQPLPWIENGPANYWFQSVLNKYDDEEETVAPGPVQWQLACSLLFLWVVIFVSVAFGKEVLAKVTYVTVIMPVVLMVILVIRGAFLEGAWDGIAFYIYKFETSKLLDLSVWATACSQILFSLSPGFGSAITYSSFVSPKADVYKTCMIVAVCNSTFSVIGAFGIFAIIGNIAYESGSTVEEVASTSGTGLAFITIARGMEFFGPAQNVMSVLFFVMLLTLGLDSQFAMTETLVAYIEDFVEEMGWTQRYGLPTWKYTLLVVCFCFLIGLPYTTRNGNNILDVVDHFVGTIFLLISCFMEAIIFNFDVQWWRFAGALKQATKGSLNFPNGRSLFPTYLCRMDFHGTVPLMTGGLILYTLYDDIAYPYNGHPSRLLSWGWSLLAIMVAAIPISWRRWNEEGDLPPLTKEEALFDQERKIVPPTNTDAASTFNESMKANVSTHSTLEVV